MAPLEVHGSPISAATMRVLACLHEKGLEFEFVPIDMSEQEHKKEPFLSLNLFGQVPAFEDGGLMLFGQTQSITARNAHGSESRAITKYIAGEYAEKEPQLITKDSKKMAITGVWMEVESQQYDQIASKLVWELCFKPLFGIPVGQAAVEENEAKLCTVVDVYEKRLSESKYLGGDSFTLADLHHLPTIHNLMNTQTNKLFESRPHVSAWVADITARPAWSKVLALQKKIVGAGKPKSQNYVSHSAVTLHCRVMPPPCIQNPYLKDASGEGTDPSGNQRSKCAGLFPANISGDGLSRYRTDFHEIEQIGAGNFGSVFKVLKRIDGCMYAVKRTIRQLHQETEKRKALMEVQALAALGYHENIVAYYNSWFENDQLYIQMELCDGSLSIKKSALLLTEGQVLETLHQIAIALQFIHGRGIAHLDVKFDNIYVKNGVYKLGDFGCATLINNSLPIEVGDERYMPQEILNENYDHLDKVDIFSLGASIFELIRRSPLPESQCQSLNLKAEKLPLLPGHSMQFQNLLKVMMDPDPVKRPSARELVENPILYRALRNTKY